MSVPSFLSPFPSKVREDAGELLDLRDRLRELRVTEYEWLTFVCDARTTFGTKWSPILPPLHLMTARMDLYHYPALNKQRQADIAFMEIWDHSRRVLADPLWVVDLWGVSYVRTEDIEKKGPGWFSSIWVDPREPADEELILNITLLPRYLDAADLRLRKATASLPCYLELFEQHLTVLRSQ